MYVCVQHNDAARRYTHITPHADIHNMHTLRYTQTYTTCTHYATRRHTQHTHITLHVDMSACCQSERGVAVCMSACSVMFVTMFLSNERAILQTRFPFQQREDFFRNVGFFGHVCKCCSVCCSLCDSACCTKCRSLWPCISDPFDLRVGRMDIVIFCHACTSLLPSM